MLTSLRFKNWRSLRDVEIDNLTPITVFIGENSSGKTNILDALKFHRDSLTKTLVPVVSELGYRRIQTDVRDMGKGADLDVELEFTYRLPISELPIKDLLRLQFDKRDLPFKYGTALYAGDQLLREQLLRELPLKDLMETHLYVRTEEDRAREEQVKKINDYLTATIQRRWQLLGDYFAPPLRMAQREGGDLYVIEPDAHNVLLMLNFIKLTNKDLYQRLEEDLHWLLDHVMFLGISQQPETRELELRVHEFSGNGTPKIAPTVSTGTARLIAMLTAFYALELPQEAPYLSSLSRITSDMPGLVIIEEPDTALNPGILEKFVELLRVFVDGEHPRQFILTTHNPRFLDYFKPEEVRVVARGEDGYTTVERIPAHVSDIWLENHTLGEVWMTRSLGGLPE